MIRKAVLLLVTLTLVNVGCCYTGTATCGWEMYTNSVRNLTEEPARFVDRLLLVSKIRQRAREAWKSVCEASPEQHYSSDYADGFEAGFRDYVEAGGSGEPPGMPPPCYRSSCYDGPGHQAVLDWYAGFRHGAVAARESGLREAVLIPLGGVPEAAVRKLGAPIGSLPDPQSSGPFLPGHVQEASGPPITDSSASASNSGEVLPQPRKIASP